MTAKSITITTALFVITRRQTCTFTNCEQLGNTSSLTQLPLQWMATALISNHTRGKNEAVWLDDIVFDSISIFSLWQSIKMPVKFKEKVILIQKTITLTYSAKPQTGAKCIFLDFSFVKLSYISLSHRIQYCHNSYWNLLCYCRFLIVKVGNWIEWSCLYMWWFLDLPPRKKKKKKTFCKYLWQKFGTFFFSISKKCL